MRFVAQECELDGVRLPVGTVVILSQWVMHRAPEIWPDAEVFKPERWDPASAFAGVWLEVANYTGRGAYNACKSSR
jgi:flavonoid 3'-monooxygenase